MQSSADFETLCSPMQTTGILTYVEFRDITCTDFCGLYHKNKSNRHRENVSVPQSALRLLLLFLVVAVSRCCCFFPLLFFSFPLPPREIYWRLLLSRHKTVPQAISVCKRKVYKVDVNYKNTKAAERWGGGGGREEVFGRRSSFWHLTALQYIMHSGIHASAWWLLAKSNFLRPR